MFKFQVKISLKFFFSNSNKDAFFRIDRLKLL